jgi:predicted DCC family thiol-disulfide oxidoreductase YuxK
VARLRYRVFGRLDACRLPRPEERGRFVDLGPSAPVQ